MKYPLLTFLLFVTTNSFASQLSDCQAAASVIQKSTPLLLVAIEKYSNDVDYRNFAEWRVEHFHPTLQELKAEFQGENYPQPNYSSPVFMAVMSNYFGRVPLIAQSIQSTLRYGDKFKPDISLHWQFAKEAGELFAKECPEQAASM